MALANYKLLKAIIIELFVINIGKAYKFFSLILIYIIYTCGVHYLR